LLTAENRVVEFLWAKLAGEINQSSSNVTIGNKGAICAFVLLALELVPLHCYQAAIWVALFGRILGVSIRNLTTADSQYF